MTDTAHYGELLEVMRRLRAPGGCPWDREQTHVTLRSYLLEEAYETVEAIDRQDWRDLCAELGDVLLQIVFHAQIAAEAGRFSMADVCQAIVGKLVYRHPHVFGDQQVDTAREVLSNWEQLKRQERASSEQPSSALDGLPAVLPALLRAQRVQGRAARVGFDWDGIGGPLAKVEEEFAELRREWRDGNGPRTEAEFGDLLFAMVNVARFLEVDAEDALRQAAAKFERRFRAVEAAFRREGRELADAAAGEMDAVWQQVKQDEDGS